MANIIRVGIIHAYPSQYIVESLARINVQVVFFSPVRTPFIHEYLEDNIECPLHDWSMVENVVRAYHIVKPLNALLPIYEGTVEITAIIAKKLGLFGADVHCAQASRNKFSSWRCWNKSKLPTPTTLDITSDKDALNTVKGALGFPAILKLADSMNSQGVILVNSDEEFLTAFKQLNKLISTPPELNDQIDRNRNAYARSDVKIIAQEYCNGPEVSVDVLCNDGYRVVGIFEKATSGGPYFGETMSVYPTSLGSERENELGHLAIQALKSLDYSSGIAHVEIRYSTNGPKILEAGLRPGGAYTVMAIEHLLRINLYIELAKIHLSIALDHVAKVDRAVLYGGIIYQQSGILSRISGMEVFDHVAGKLDVKILNKVNDLVFALPDSAQPHFCYYLLSAATRDEVIAQHQLISSQINIEIT